MSEEKLTTPESLIRRDLFEVKLVLIQLCELLKKICGGKHAA